MNTKEEKMNITEEQFNEYLFVQDMGAYNMFDRRARELTELSRDEWVEIIKNYDELREKYVKD